MASDWATVEILIRQLGSVCSAADAAGASFASRAAIDQAVREATEAVSLTIENRPKRAAVERAARALDVAVEVIGALASEADRSRQLSADSAKLRARSRELIQSARPAFKVQRGSP
jgi:hypothetical protein